MVALFYETVHTFVYRNRLFTLSFMKRFVCRMSQWDTVLKLRLCEAISFLSLRNFWRNIKKKEKDLVLYFKSNLLFTLMAFASEVCYEFLFLFLIPKYLIPQF